MLPGSNRQSSTDRFEISTPIDRFKRSKTKIITRIKEFYDCLRCLRLERNLNKGLRVKNKVGKHRRRGEPKSSFENATSLFIDLIHSLE